VGILPIRDCWVQGVNQSSINASLQFIAGLPPYECKDVSNKFGDIMAIADNAFIYAVNTLTEPQNGGWPYLLGAILRDYHRNLGHLGYELEKIR
jgi:hypothetical protein